MTMTNPPAPAANGGTGASRGSDAESRLRAEFPVVIEIPVAWAEMDYFRHVNHAVFFTYFESARIPYLERIGFRALADGRQVGPILATAQARYRRPVEYPDTLLVGARATEMGEDRFTHAYRCVSRALDDVAAEGSATIVSYDYAAARKTAIPPEVRRAIAEVEGWGEAR